MKQYIFMEENTCKIFIADEQNVITSQQPDDVF